MLSRFPPTHLSRKRAARLSVFMVLTAHASGLFAGGSLPLIFVSGSSYFEL